MKRFLPTLIMMLALSFSLSAQEHSPRPPKSTPSSTPPATSVMDSSGWVKFTSDDGHFSVMMPETPTDKTETTDSTHGPYTTHLFIVKDTTSVYLIGWVDYDPSFNFNRQAELEANREELASAVDEVARSRYDRLVRSKGENVVVGIQHGVCGGCHMRVQPQLLVACRAEKELVTCSNCGRILYYTRDMDLAVAE